MGITTAYTVGRTARYPALALALVASPAQAQEAQEAETKEGWTLAAGARVRGEATRDDFRAGAPTRESALLTRASLFVGYRAGPLELAGEIQDARVFGEPPGSIDADDANALEPIQLYARLRPAAGVALQGGRFTIDLGSRRFVARTNFRNTNNSFSGARLDLERGHHSLGAFWVLPSDRLPDDDAGIAAHRVVLDRERTGLQFFGAVAASGDADRGAFDAGVLRLHERDAPGIATRDRRLWTLTARHHRAPAEGRIDHEVEGAWQTGRASTSSAAGASDASVRAGFVRAELGYSFAAGWAPRVQIALDYASGDGQGAMIGRFDTLYGDGSFELGPSSLYSLVARANLISPELRGEIEPDDRTDAYLAVRPLWLASATDRFGNSDVRDPAGLSGRFAGTQVEGRVRRWLVPDRLRLTAGAAYLAKGRFLRDAPNAPPTGDTRYGYVELTLEL